MSLAIQAAERERQAIADARWQWHHLPWWRRRRTPEPDHRAAAERLASIADSEADRLEAANPTNADVARSVAEIRSAAAAIRSSVSPGPWT